MKKILFTILSVLTLGVLVSFSQIPTNGLYGFYGFNNSGVNQTGKGGDAVISGTTPVQDRFGNQDGAIKVVGSNPTEITSDSFLTRDFILSFWFKTSTSNGVLVSTSNGLSPNGYTIRLEDGYVVASNNSTQVKSDSVYNDTMWHNVLMFQYFDQVSVVSLIVDGTPAKSSYGLNQVLYVTDKLRIGNFVGGSTNDGISSVSIDDLLLYPNSNPFTISIDSLKSILTDSSNYIPTIDTVKVDGDSIIVTGKNLKGGVVSVNGIKINVSEKSNTVMKFSTNLTGDMKLMKNYDVLTLGKKFNTGIEFLTLGKKFNTVNINVDLTDYVVSVYTITGQLKIQTKNVSEINLTEKGFYIIQINSDDIKMTKRILIN
jgi:hypothetical protein